MTTPLCRWTLPDPGRASPVRGCEVLKIHFTRSLNSSDARQEWWVSRYGWNLAGRVFGVRGGCLMDIVN